METIHSKDWSNRNYTQQELEQWKLYTVRTGAMETIHTFTARARAMKATQNKGWSNRNYKKGLEQWNPYTTRTGALATIL